MPRVLRLAVPLLLVGAACRGDADPLPELAPIEVPREDLDALVAANDAFAADLWGELRAQEGNLFLSPLTVSSALSMTLAGARGETAEELRRALHLDLPADRLHAAWHGLLVELLRAADGDQELALQNGLFTDPRRAFREEFRSVLEGHYGAEPRQLDFAEDPEGARGVVNDWVAERTRGHVEELFPRGSLGDRTRLVLVSAAYFLGRWKEEFDPGRTREEPFRLPGGGTRPARLMRLEERFRYVEEQDLQVLELPYRGDRLSLLVLLPAEPDGLPALESRLSADTLRGWVASLRSRKVDVALPRFSFDWNGSLVAPLERLGVREAFSDAADLSGMDGTRELAVEAVVHGAHVEVDEEGTRAAAATGVSVGVTSEAGRPVVFRADRPFLFLVRDSATGALLFMGRLVSP